MPDERPRDRDQALRNSAGLHQLAGEDEKWNREQREAVDRTEGAARNDGERRAFHQHQADRRGGAERERDRHA